MARKKIAKAVFGAGGLGSKVASFHVSLKSPEMRGVPVSVHPIRNMDGMGQRMDRMTTFIREFQGRTRGSVRGKMGVDWKLYSQMRRKDPQTAALLLMDAMQTFGSAPLMAVHELRAQGLREFTTKADFPAEVRDIIEKYHVG